MRLIIHKLILLFSISSFFTAQSTAQNQDLQLTYQYSLFDVYHIQDRYTNNPSCITSRTETGGEAGYTKVEERTESAVDYSPSGVPYLVPGNKIRKEVKVPSTYYSYRVFTNTCSEYAKVKAIRKIRLTTGQTMYEDASFWVKPGATEQKTIKYVDDYNSQTAEIGSVIAYKNPLNIDSDAHNTYVNSVINSDKGTLVVTPTSTETRISLEPGDKVIIRAEGSVRLGMFAGYGGPNGIGGFATYSTTTNAKHGSLIYRFGGSDWTFLGSSNTLTVHKPGYLSLAVNDNSTDDDEGQFIVNYEIIRATSTSASMFNSLPQSCSDLEKIANFNKKDLDTYLANNSFTSAGEKDGIKFLKREGDDDELALGFKKDYLNHKNILVFATDSEERYQKIKNSLSVEGYVYTRNEDKVDIYKKTAKRSQSSFNIEIGIRIEDDIYTVILVTSNN
ncbi:hypothetical protein [Spirosoma validum]|uniref:Uncharacterized protein n=1 Tax=Spirosoma validum TaxID=2771355 RepID=A0A927B1R3_9BACT|nr:hypothetical protein [Spirosoma validum]MBD2753964.1 hypothetical protein [Spirosoma validum]